MGCGFFRIVFSDLLQYIQIGTRGVYGSRKNRRRKQFDDYGQDNASVGERRDHDGILVASYFILEYVSDDIVIFTHASEYRGRSAEDVADDRKRDELYTDARVGGVHYDFE